MAARRLAALVFAAWVGLMLGVVPLALRIPVQLVLAGGEIRNRVAAQRIASVLRGDQLHVQHFGLLLILNSCR